MPSREERKRVLAHLDDSAAGLNEVGDVERICAQAAALLRADAERIADLEAALVEAAKGCKCGFVSLKIGE